MQQMLVVSDLHIGFGGDNEVSTLKDELLARNDQSPWIYSEPIDLPDGSKGWAIVQKPASSKCERCWRYRADGQVYDEDLKAYQGGYEDNESQAATEDERKEQLCVRCKTVMKKLERQS